MPSPATGSIVINSAGNAWADGATIGVSDGQGVTATLEATNRKTAASPGNIIIRRHDDTEGFDPDRDAALLTTDDRWSSDLSGGGSQSIDTNGGQQGHTVETAGGRALLYFDRADPDDPEWDGPDAGWEGYLRTTGFGTQARIWISDGVRIVAFRFDATHGLVCDDVDGSQVASVAWASGEWHRVMLRRSTDGSKFEAFVDGTLVSDIAYTDCPTNGTDRRITLGATAGHSAYEFSVAWVSLFDGERTAADIASEINTDLGAHAVQTTPSLDGTTVELTQDVAGSAGNVAISTNNVGAAATVSGMSGGTDVADQSRILLEEWSGGSPTGNRRALGSNDTLALDRPIHIDDEFKVAADGEMAGEGALTVSAVGILTLDGGSHVRVDLPDDDGTSKFEVRDSGGGVMFSIDSDGNLTKAGANFIIEGTTVRYADGLLLLNKDQAGGSPNLDAGFIAERGTLNNIFFGWDESADEIVFADIGDSDVGDGSTVTPGSYVAIRAGAATFTGAVTVTDGQNFLLGGYTVDDILDEDDLSSDSDTALATQQSIKAYVDAAVGAVATTLAGLTDATITGPADLDVLQWDNGSSKWVDRSLSEAGIQAQDDVLDDLAALNVVAADQIIVGNGAGTFTYATATAAGLALLDDADASAQRTTLGLGSVATYGVLDEDDLNSDSDTDVPTQQSVKAYVDAQITGNNTVAELTDTTITGPADLDVLQWDNGSSKWVDRSLSEAGIQAQSDVLDDLDTLGAAGAADKFIYSDGAGSFAYGDVTSFGRSLIDDADAAAARGTLGLDTDDDVEFAAVTGTTGDFSGDFDIDGTANLDDVDIDGDTVIASGKEIQFEGYTAADTNPAANNLLFVMEDDAGTMKARLPNPSSTGGSFLLSRINGIWRTGSKAVRFGRANTVLVEDGVAINPGDALYASTNQKGRVTVFGDTGAPGAGEWKVFVGYAIGAVADAQTDATVAVDLALAEPVQL